MTSDKRTERLGDFAWTRPPAPVEEARGPLTRDQIVEAAIRLADRDGLAALSMRKLGQELDAGATSLYWHVKNKDQLEDLVLDAMIGEVTGEIALVEGWREQLAEMARALRRVLIRHRNIAPLLGDRPTVGPNALDAAEWVMAVLHDAGFDARTISMASGALINYASGFALFEAKSPGGDSTSPEAKAMADAVMAYFRALPPERYPNLLAVAGENVSDDDAFEYGLQRLLDGFEADRARSPRPPKTKPGKGGEGMNVMLTR